MKDDLLREMAAALHDLLLFTDAEGPIGDEDADEWREQVMERACDALSSYHSQTYEMCDSEVIWPQEEEDGFKPPNTE